MSEVRGLALVDDAGSVSVRGDKWLRSASRQDRRVLARAVGPVLDVGCGPGRHSEALQARGVEVLGVDVSRSVLEKATRRGIAVLVASVFDPLPRMGEWRTALLLDGNSGLGGDPVRLLCRLRHVLGAEGRVLTDLVTGPREPGPPRRLRLRYGKRSGPDFTWAPLHADDLATVADASGFEIVNRWSGGRQEYAELRMTSTAP